MAPQELISYIVQQLKIKTEFEDIKKSLLESGWDEKGVDEAYQEVLGAPSLPVSAEDEHVFERFSSQTSRERTLKRIVILGVGVGLVAFALSVVL